MSKEKTTASTKEQTSAEAVQEVVQAFEAFEEKVIALKKYGAHYTITGILLQMQRNMNTLKKIEF